MKLEDQIELMQKTGFKTENKVKYLGVAITNMNCMYFKIIVLRHGLKFKRTC